MAFVGLDVPHETARLLNTIEIEGEKESPSSFHITLLFLGDNVSIGALAKALGATYKVSSTTRPFTVSTSRVTCFPKGPDGVPIICRVDSDALYDLRARLAEAFDKAKITYSKKHEFNGHLTLAYAKKEIEEQRIPTVEWGAHEIVIWGGDSEDDRIIMTFPMTLADPDTAAKVAARFQRGVSG